LVRRRCAGMQTPGVRRELSTTVDFLVLDAHATRLWTMLMIASLIGR
jgi:hypothetical protein